MNKHVSEAFGPSHKDSTTNSETGRSSAVPGQSEEELGQELAARFPQIRHEKKRAFLIAFGEMGTVVDAARVARIHRSTHYHWLKTDPEYAEAYKESEDRAVDVLERIAWLRATEGLPEDVWYKGEVHGTRKARSDLILMFLLKARRPEKYRERYETHLSGAGGGSLEVRFVQPE